MPDMKRPVLVVTAMYPHTKSVANGIFVKQQMDSLAKADPAITVEVLHLQGHRKLRYLTGIVQVCYATYRRRYSLVHAHYGLAALAAIVRWRTPLVVTLHGSDVNIPWQRLLSRVACFWASAVIVQSPGMHQLLRMPRTHIIPVGVDLQMFQELDRSQCRKELGWPDDMPIVLFPGDPARPVKDFPLFQRAIDVVEAQGVHVRVMTLAGGQYSYEKMPTVLNACDVLVLTSKTEGSPMVIKEALACNIPIVSVDVGDVAHRIDGTDGCAIVARDPDSMAAHIMAVLAHGQRVAGRRQVQSVSEAAVAQQILQIYAQVTQTKQGVRS
ncbi:MAG: glycosyltransferase family 4 protein [Herpetosiphon sp.]